MKADKHLSYRQLLVQDMKEAGLDYGDLREMVRDRVELEAEIKEQEKEEYQQGKGVKYLQEKTGLSASELAKKVLHDPKLFKKVMKMNKK